MAPKKKREITVGSGIDIPPLLYDSIYPWDDLIQEDTENPHIFVACDDEEEARGLRGSVQQSGRSYYNKRKLAFSVTARVIETDGKWGVYAWALKTESVDE